MRTCSNIQFLNIAAMVLRVMNLVLLILLLGHWNACMQFMIPMLQEFPTNCWVSIEELKVYTLYYMYMSY